MHLTDNEFQRLLDAVITPDVYNAAQTLRNINSFERDDGTPLNYSLVNIRDWCKNDFEVVNQLRINTDNSHHRYDVMLLINGVPVVQIELKALSVSPRRAMQQIVDYKTDLAMATVRHCCVLSNSSSSAIVLILGTSRTIMHDISVLMPMSDSCQSTSSLVKITKRLPS